jgi:hypothetical protein
MNCAFCNDTRGFAQAYDENENSVMVHADEITQYREHVRRKKIEKLESAIRLYQAALDRLRSEK